MSELQIQAFDTVMVSADLEDGLAYVLTDPGEWEEQVSPNLQQALDWLRQTVGPAFNTSNVDYGEEGSAPPETRDGKRTQDFYRLYWDITAIDAPDPKPRTVRPKPPRPFRTEDEIRRWEAGEDIDWSL